MTVFSDEDLELIRRHPGLGDEAIVRALELAGEGRTRAEIAAILDAPECEVRYWTRRAHGYLLAYHENQAVRSEADTV